MRVSWSRWAGIAVLSGTLVLGCAGDLSKRLATDTAFQAAVMDAIASNPELASRMADRLMGGESHALVMERVLANGPTVQGLMAKVAQDQTVLDGVLNLAVQDSAMRAHILTLFEGMRMMKGRTGPRAPTE
ncbi:MAG TPA: hypothetical protein VGK89_08550 [Candidatus Eisenbacteria bacterium]|jgi:hypothetical protein